MVILGAVVLVMGIVLVIGRAYRPYNRCDVDSQYNGYKWLI